MNCVTDHFPFVTKLQIQSGRCEYLGYPNSVGFALGQVVCNKCSSHYSSFFECVVQRSIPVTESLVNDVVSWAKVVKRGVCNHRVVLISTHLHAWWVHVAMFGVYIFML